MIKLLEVKEKTVKCLEENVGLYFSEHRIEEDFLNKDTNNAKHKNAKPLSRDSI